MNYDATYTQMNIKLGDTEDVTFTPEEKALALQEAWDDYAVTATKWDTSLTFSATSYQYALPTGVDNVLDVYISASNSTADEPSKIAQTLWEVVDGNLQFKNNANAYIEDGYTLYLKYNKKLDYATDTLDTKNLQQFVINLGAWNTLELLGYKKANLFLKNDITMGEMITLRRELERKVNKLRAALPRAFVSV